MGTAQSLINMPNLVAAALVLGIAASVWRNQPTGSSGTTTEQLSTEKSATGKKGKKKKSAGGNQLDVAGSGLLKSDDGVGGGRSATPDLAASSLSEHTIPGGIGSSGEDVLGSSAALEKPVKDKKKKGKKNASQVPTSQIEDRGAAAPVAGPSRPSTTSKASAAPPSLPPKPEEETWTRVDSKRKTSSQNQTTASDAGITTTSMDESGSLASLPDKSEEGSKTKPPPKTFAEKMLPKGRKTVVDDMLETPHYPEVARVMRVTPAPHEKPAVGFSWGDYEDVEDVRGAEADGEDDGWGIVKSRGRAKHPQSPSSGVLQPPPKAPESLTKKQRQRLEKREQAKAARAQGDAEREALLAKRQRERDRERIDELNKASKSKLSGGQTMVVEDARAVWSS